MPIIRMCECDVCKKRSDLRLNENGFPSVPETWLISGDIVICGMKCYKEHNKQREDQGLKPLKIKKTKQQIRDHKLKKILE